MSGDHAASDVEEDLGSIGVVHLRRLWSRTLARRFATLRVADDPDEWVEHDTLMRGLHLDIRETLSELYDRTPTFEEFERWIVERNGGTIEPERVARINAALTGQSVSFDDISAEPVFGERDLAWWDEHGYVVLHDAVPPENLRAAEDAIWTFLAMDRNDPETWYANAHGRSIWVPLRHDPVLWANRNAPRVRRAFAQLWNREDLWVTVDQVGFNPPERPGWTFPGPHLHWDTSLATPIPFDLQGILYLVDVAANQGAFTCVPGFHRRIESWLHELPAQTDPRHVDLSASAVPIAGRAGDLVIWRSALPHGSSPNRASRPRIVQYIKMQPSRWETSRSWK